MKLKQAAAALSDQSRRAPPWSSFLLTIMTELPKPDSVLSEDYNANAKSLYRLVYDTQSSANNKEDLRSYCRISPPPSYQLNRARSLEGTRSCSPPAWWSSIFQDLWAWQDVFGTFTSIIVNSPFLQIDSDHRYNILVRKHKGITPVSSSDVSRSSLDRWCECQNFSWGKPDQLCHGEKEGCGCLSLRA